MQEVKCLEPKLPFTQIARMPMRKVLLALLVTIPTLMLPGCSAVSTFDKYATLRFYELYRTDIKYSYFDGASGLRSSNPNFRDVMLPARNSRHL